MSDRVVLTSPLGTGDISVREEAVEMYLARGWVRETVKKAPAKKAASSKSVEK